MAPLFMPPLKDFRYILDRDLEADRERQRETERDRERQRERQRQRDRKRESEGEERGREGTHYGFALVRKTSGLLLFLKNTD